MKSIEEKQLPVIPVVTNCCEICGQPLEGMRSPYGDAQLKGSTICVLCFLNPKKQATH